MTELSGGYADTRFTADIEAPLPGRTEGFAPPPIGIAVEFDSMATLVVPMALGSDLTTGSPTAPSAPAANDLGEAHPWDMATVGFDWFEHIHIVPRAKIDFGNIITQVEEDYEIFSAYRNSGHTITNIDNNVAPGVELPTVSAPQMISPLRSLLNTASTYNHDLTTGLGTLVKTVVRATSKGLPFFDSNILFEVSSNDVELFMSGSRIVLIPQEYEAPVTETLSFLTDIITALDGSEQRIALRKNPRQLFEVTYKLTTNDRQRMQALLMDWTDQVFGFPVQHEALKLTSAVSSGATSYPVLAADEVDLRLGGLAVVITDANTFDVITIDALTSTTITAADVSINAYPAGTLIMPMRTVNVVRTISGSREINNMELFKVLFEVTDNDTGALSGDVSAYSTYNSKVLFDDCNVVSGPMAEQYKRRVYRIDNRTGRVAQTSTWDRGKRHHQKGFVLHNRLETLNFRRAMISIAGRQKSFYIPTFIEDLEVKANLVSAASTMDIERIEYERFIQSREPKRTFLITFTDGSSLVRIVQSVASVDTTTERLTLDTTWPANRTVAEVVRVQFYEPTRFGGDNVVIKHSRVGLASTQMPVVQVFDDN